MKHAILVALIACVSGCSSMKVSSEKSGDFDFSAVKTYEWVRAPAEILNEDDTVLNEDLHKLLNNQLAGRGWEQVMISDKADTQVVYYIKLSEHEEYTSAARDDESRVTGGFTYDNDKGAWGYKDQAPDLNVYTVETGTLTLLIYDAEANAKVWQGTLQTKLDRGAPLEKQRLMLAEVANKITAKIP